MSFRNNFLRQNKITDNIDDLKVQLIEYYESDGDIDFDNGIFHKYEICMFGITEKSESVCIIIEDFKPFFYIEVPHSFKDSERKRFIEYLKEQEFTNRYNNNKKLLKYPLMNATSKIVRSYKCDGFQKNKTTFLKIEFNSLYGYNCTKTYFFDFIKNKTPLNWNNKNWIPRLYESDISPLLRYFHYKNIKTCGWINIKDTKSVSVLRRKSLCQYECRVDYNDVISLDITDIGSLTIASFDIECTSGDGSFPSAFREEDKIIQIGTTFEKYNDENTYYNVIITLGGCDDIKDTDVISCHTELELLIEWCKLIQDTDPDIITGYNINVFDFKYITDRMKYLIKDKDKKTQDNIKERILKLGRLNKTCRVIEKKLESSALGQNELIYVDMTGRINVDLIAYIRKEAKLESYSLNNVSKIYLNNQKNDVSPNDIFKLQKGSDTDRMIIAEYCIQDCKLCNKLMTKLSVIPNTFGMASTCYIPNNYISFRGQGIKGHSLVVKYAAKLGYIIPSSRIELINADYKGATVIEPKIGSHFYPVSCLDFASLYPSCMISHNLCITSIITDDNDLNIPGRVYKSISWDDDNGKEKKYTYIQPESEDKRALLPTILKILLKKRKDTRALQQKVYKTDPFKASILNGLQLSYKTTANSIYGLLGAATSAISRPEIAASITTTGRTLLDIAASRVLKHFRNSKIIYGDTDSIFVKFDLRKHCDTCKFHKNNIDKRFEMFEYFVKKYTNELQEKINKGERPEIKHSIQETAMLESKFQLYKDCDCPDIKNEMSKEALQESIDLGFQAEKIFDFLLPYPHKLEYEKTYLPYISFSKKRYIGYLYETDINKSKLDCKGIVLKRRDNAPIVKQFYNTAVKLILEHKIDEALEQINKDIELMFDGKMNPDLFTITKTLKTINSYKISFLKKKFYINDAINMIKLILYTSNIIDNTDFISLTEYLKIKPVNHNKYYTGSTKFDLFNYILNEDEIKETMRNINFESLKNIINFKKTTTQREILDLITLCEFNMKKFSKLENISGNDGIVNIDKFLKKYEKKISLSITQKLPQAHVALNMKLKKRDLGSAFNANDRIPYCFIFKREKKGTKLLQSDIVELPEYVKEHNIKLDYLYYLEKQLEKPLLQLFEMVDKHKEFSEIIQKYVILAKNQKKGIRSLI